MISETLHKLSTFGTQHQLLFTLVIALGIICVNWGVEKILDEYFFPHKPLQGYILVIIGGLFFLWLTKHIILHVM